MLKHVVVWKLNEEFSAQEKMAKAVEIKEALEGLKGKIEQIIDIEVGIDGNIGSACSCQTTVAHSDVCLVSSFESVEALKEYAGHPEHLKVVELVKPCVCSRAVVDYIVG